jgi:Asp-tRNA(Asn)/Glu-tRNA(Gln) amidotransferase A subunit family amidase
MMTKRTTRKIDAELKARIALEAVREQATVTDALANRTPMAVWREGTAGALGDKAVDMTFRLDNAIALPTCPQLQQQQLVA